MKLSKNGLHKVLCEEETVHKLAKAEFSQNDFVGGVVLSLEEAKMIEELALLALFLKPNMITIEKAKVMKEFSHRIELAELGE